MSTRSIVEYVWIDGDGKTRSKTRVCRGEVSGLSDLPVWNYDGSSTGQADGSDSEVLIHPRALFRDPFREGGWLTLCDTYLPDGNPHPTNKNNSKTIVIFLMSFCFNPITWDLTLTSINRVTFAGVSQCTC